MPSLEMIFINQFIDDAQPIWQVNFDRCWSMFLNLRSEAIYVAQSVQQGTYFHAGDINSLSLNWEFRKWQGALGALR